MGPVFMILGHSAADAAALAIQHDTAVQDVDVSKVQRILTATFGQRVHGPPRSKRWGV